MSNMIEEKSEQRKEQDFRLYQEELQLDEREIEEISRGKEENKTILFITISLLPETELKYTRAYLCLKNIREFGKILKTLPDEANLKAENFDLSFKILLISNEVINIPSLRQNIESITSVENIKITVFNIHDVLEEAQEKSIKERSSKDGNMIYRVG